MSVRVKDTSDFMSSIQFLPTTRIIEKILVVKILEEKMSEFWAFCSLYAKLHSFLAYSSSN